MRVSNLVLPRMSKTQMCILSLYIAGNEHSIGVNTFTMDMNTTAKIIPVATDLVNQRRCLMGYFNMMYLSGAKRVIQR